MQQQQSAINLQDQDDKNSIDFTSKIREITEIIENNDFERLKILEENGHLELSLCQAVLTHNKEKKWDLINATTDMNPTLVQFLLNTKKHLLQGELQEITQRDIDLSFLVAEMTRKSLDYWLIKIKQDCAKDYAKTEKITKTYTNLYIKNQNNNIIFQLLLDATL